jgi:GTP cyclohydrolase I
MSNLRAAEAVEDLDPEASDRAAVRNEGHDGAGGAGGYQSGAGAAPEVLGRRLHVVGPEGSAVDLTRAAAAVADLLQYLGVDTSAPGLVDTPERVARAYAEFLTPEPFEATTFPNTDNYGELVAEVGIPFSSLCEHHLLPFSGVAHVGYVPGARLVGLSKLARAVSFFSRRLQVQERLTTQIADWLDATLQPRGTGVVLEAEHACLSTRGARAYGSRTVTSALRGLVRDDERSRAEFLARAGARP